MNRRQFFATSAAAVVSAGLPKVAGPGSDEWESISRWLDQDNRRVGLVELLYGPLPPGPTSHIFPTSFFPAPVDA